MIGIYENEFIDYLQNALGSRPKVTSTNIICPCPWCEYGKRGDHYHLYISLKDPIFNCFHAGCNTSGFISKLINKIEGTDSSVVDKYIDLKSLKKSKPKAITSKKSSIQIPELDVDQFPYKKLYMSKRFKFSRNIDMRNVTGLIFDFFKFMEINKLSIPETDKNYKLQFYIQTNFVGFVTNNRSYIIFRNIDDNSEFRYWKFTINEKTKFLDYYRIQGNNSGKYIVLAEGIFDIYSQYLFDFLEKKSDIIMYACSASSNYENLIKSIVFNEQIFRLNLLILSDDNIPLKYYEQLKKYNKHIIESMSIYYNKTGKDFNDLPVILNEFKI